MFTVKWNLTDRCLLQCVHCSNAEFTRQTGSNQDRVPALMERLSEIPIGFLHLSGGEPFLSKHVYRIIEHFTGKGTTVAVNTSGYGLTSEELQPILSNSRVIMLVSIDGVSDEANDAIRGPGVFRRVRQLLHDVDGRRGGRKCQVGVNFTLTRTALHEALALVNYATTLPCDFLVINDLWEMGRARRVWKELSVTPAERIAFLCSIASHLGRDAQSTLRWRLTPLLSLLMAQEYGFRCEPNMTCNAGGSMLFLESNGDVYPCIKYRLLGQPGTGSSGVTKHNLLDHSFEEIYFGELFVGFRRRITDRAYCESPCASCRFKDECIPCPFEMETQRTECELVKERLRACDLRAVSNS